MTDEMMSLRALLEKTPDADLLREMIGFAAQRLMGLEVEGPTGAGYRGRLAQRNGESVNHYPTRSKATRSTWCCRSKMPPLPMNRCRSCCRIVD
jgi:hypothetical protein